MGKDGAIKLTDIDRWLSVDVISGSAKKKFWRDICQLRLVCLFSYTANWKSTSDISSIPAEN